VIALFKDAMKNSDHGTEHWACTERTTIKNGKGRVRGETVVTRSRTPARKGSA